MVDRFIQFYESVNTLILEGGPMAKEIGEAMLTSEEINQVKNLHANLIKMQSASTMLQHKDGTIN